MKGNSNPCGPEHPGRPGPQQVTVCGTPLNQQHWSGRS